MPATINGIGTHYYGAKNRSARVDTCKQCGRSATLSSYDTREWFCILFIPLIPIKKYRILNDCSRCRKHFRIAQDEFAKKLAEATAPIKREIRSSPGNPEPQIQLIHTLIGWEMREEAARELDAAMKAFPQNVDLMTIAGQLAVDRNDFPRAVSIYERAYSIDSANPGVTYGYAWVLQASEQWEKAIPVLQRATSQEANRKGALYLLGKSHMKLQHWNDALNAFQQLLALEPAYLNDKALLRLVRECKEHLGYQLTDAEKRAGRKWWPFGRKQKRATLQGPSTLVRPSLRYAGIAIVAIMIVSLAVVGWDKWTNLNLYLDNGLDRTVKVELDDRRFDLGAGSMRNEEMSSGPHNVVIRDAKTDKEIERMSFALDKLDPFTAILHDRFFVYNVSGRHIYRRANVGYAQNRDNASYSAELIAMQRFFEQRDVDYPFTTPPETIESDAGSSVIHKVSFNVANDLDLRKYAILKAQEGRAQEAKDAIARAVAFAPCDTPTRRTELSVASMTGKFETANDAAKHWIADCSADDLEAHRAYQDLNREQGRTAEIRDEYRKLVATSPQSGKAHYLYGRVSTDPQVAVAEYQQAIQLDPALVWPRVALGHAYESLDRYDDAFGEFRAALDMKGCDPSVVNYYAHAAIAKGAPRAAVDKVEEIRKDHAKDPYALHARWLLSLAAADWDTAEKTEKAMEPQQGNAARWWLTTKRLRLKQDSALNDRLDAAMKSKDLGGIALDLRIERAIEAGEFMQAADLIGKNAKDLDPSGAAVLEAYAAGGLILKNDSADGLKLLDDAHKLIAEAPKGSARQVTEALIDGLRGTMPLDAAIAVARDNDAMSHAWFVSAVRAAQAGDRKGASESLARCVRAASDLDFPYLEVKAMAARLQ